jgi:hypothetical protein
LGDDDDARRFVGAIEHRRLSEFRIQFHGIVGDQSWLVAEVGLFAAAPRSVRPKVSVQQRQLPSRSCAEHSSSNFVLPMPQTVVAGDRLRTVMSSIMRRRRGLNRPSRYSCPSGWAPTPTSSQPGGDLRHLATHAATAASLCAGHAQQLGGESPLPNLMEVKG